MNYETLVNYPVSWIEMLQDRDFILSNIQFAYDMGGVLWKEFEFD